ncbi:MAG: hypothetical protein Q8S29_03565 [Phreatobacter sp.]|nr:hypothetical protein [Phreatobacter sp.]
MRKTLLTTALAALFPAAAMAMPVAPLPGSGDGLMMHVQDCGPPIRRIETDPNTGTQTPVWVRQPCPRVRGGGYYERPAPRVYYGDPPGYRPAPRYYDDAPVYRQRRAPPPGWERDPYTGRDVRILR